MIISNYTPELTVSEAQRFWMTPVEVCELAAVGDATDPKIKKLLNTISDRGHVPFEKSGEAKTAPRLYSLASAVMLRVFFEITRDGRTYKYAQPVADAVRKTMLKAIAEVPELSDFDLTYGSSRLVFQGMNKDGGPTSVKWHKGEVSGNFNFSYSVLDGGYMIFRIIDLYVDPWYRNLVERGEMKPSQPMQIGEDGWPVEDAD
ncbi:MAG: hypothetical protein CMF72_15430 [Mameliella sp.]|nr:hypothetical protein [Mameliella sp.]|tara:strand:- start:4851 stop:5459 length:609 start_codon:yes stop_codon:yes gene_type:complete